MTKDLALTVHGSDMKREHWVTTTDFLNTLRKNLDKKFGKK